MAASILCFSAGILLLMPVFLGKTVKIDKKDLSQTMESGRWQERSAVDDLIKKIEESEKWYDQWRAYRALRALGWKQTGSR